MHKFRQEEEKRQNQVAGKFEVNPLGHIKRYLKVLVIFFILIFGLEIWMMNRLATYGNKIQEMKEIRASLELENQVLENQIAQVTSLSSLETQAISLGFSAMKNLEYIKPDLIASAR